MLLQVTCKGPCWPKWCLAGGEKLWADIKQTLLPHIALQCSLGAVPSLAFGVIFPSWSIISPGSPTSCGMCPCRLGCLARDYWISSSNWLLFISIVAHSHVSHCSGKDSTDKLNFQAEKLDGFQQSLSPNRTLGQVRRYFYLSAPAGGLGKKTQPNSIS